MRIKDKEVLGKEKLGSIINDATVIHVAMCEGNMPYVVPLNYGYDGKSFYVHGAIEGKKCDIIKQNPNVWFEITSKQDIVESDLGCDWTCDYRSVMGKGTAVIVESAVEIRRGLASIMKKFSPDTEYEYPDKMVSSVCVIRIDIEEMTGKSTRPL